MAVNMKGKDIITLHDLTQEEIYQIVKTAEFLKMKNKMGELYQPLKGKTLGMIFTKASTRTRISFEVGIYQLGGMGLFLNVNDLQLRRGESIADTARVMSRYLDGIMIRTYDHKDVVQLAQHAEIPVINGLTDLTHPCQILSDFLTIYEKLGRLQGIKVAYVGDGNNVAHSLMFGGAKVGMDISVVCPKGYEPDKTITEMAKEDAKASGAKIVVTQDIDEGVYNADIIYTDVWVSMGQESEKEERLKAFDGYQVDVKMMQKTGKSTLHMNCLPVYRGEAVTAEVADAPYSIIFDQAENRLHAQKAVMALIL
jgi:ornithine carbamoyltransferase